MTSIHLSDASFNALTLSVVQDIVRAEARDLLGDLDFFAVSVYNQAFSGDWWTLGERKLTALGAPDRRTASLDGTLERVTARADSLDRSGHAISVQNLKTLVNPSDQGLLPVPTYLIHQQVGSSVRVDIEVPARQRHPDHVVHRLIDQCVQVGPSR